MNWITKFIKPKIDALFKKKTADSDEILWTTCECKNLIYKEDLQSNFNCCPKCGSHHKLSCNERFELFFDNKNFEILKLQISYYRKKFETFLYNLVYGEIHTWGSN